MKRIEKRGEGAERGAGQSDGQEREARLGKGQAERASAQSIDDFFGWEGRVARLCRTTLEQMLEAELRAFRRALEAIYQAPNCDPAATARLNLATTGGAKESSAVKSGQAHWPARNSAPDLPQQRP